MQLRSPGGVPRDGIAKQIKRMCGSKNSKLGAQFSVLGRIILMPERLTKLVRVMRREARMKICVQIFLGPAPIKFAGALTGAISGIFRLRSQISLYGSRYPKAENGVYNYSLPSLEEKMVNFGPLATTFCCLISTNR